MFPERFCDGRRNYDALLDLAQRIEIGGGTVRSYAGHEDGGAIGIIHMNGAFYDSRSPELTHPHIKHISGWRMTPLGGVKRIYVSAETSSTAWRRSSWVSWYILLL